MRLSWLPVSVVCACALAGSAHAWPQIVENAKSIHVELPVVHLPPLITSVRHHIHPKVMHFPPVDVEMPKTLTAVHTPLDLVEKVVYTGLPQYLPWTTCTLASATEEGELNKEQTEKCEDSVYAQMKAVGINAITAARAETKEINEAAKKAGKNAADAQSLNQPAVESICEASSFATCEVAAPDACKNVIAMLAQKPQATAAAMREMTPAGTQAACEDEVMAACATLVQAVCETSGHVVASTQKQAKEGK